MTGMSIDSQRFDARFWGMAIVGSLLAATFGCFALAAVAQTGAADTAGIVSVTEALRQVEHANGSRVDGPVRGWR